MMLVDIKITVVCGIVLCTFVDSYRSFEGTFCLHLLYPKIYIYIIS
jgi:hypothetical protein